MVTLALALQLSAATPSPLGAARAHLSRDDTAAAVTALLPIAVVDAAIPSDHLAALFVLQWISRSPGQRRARTAWSDARDAVWVTDNRGPAGDILLGAVTVDEGRVPVAQLAELAGAFGTESWDARIAELRDSSGLRDSLLAAGAAWALAQQGLWILRLAIDSVRPLDTLPTGCRPPAGERTRRRRGPEPEPLAVAACTLRTPPPAGATPAAIAARADGGRLLHDLRRNLAAARRGPWPYRELAARLQVVVEAFLGDSAALRAVAHDTLDLSARALREIRGIALELAGLRDAAALDLLDESAPYRVLDRERQPLPSSALIDEVFWQAAWPLLLQPYNARLVTHRARVLLSDLVGRVGPPDEGGAFGGMGRRESLIRIGVPRALVWVRGGARGGARHPVPVTYVPASFHETLVGTDDPARLPSLSLALAARDTDAPVSATSGFAAVGYHRLRPFEHQVFQYRRDGRHVVDFHATRPPAPDCALPGARVGFFLLDGRLRPSHEVIRSAADYSDRFLFRAYLGSGAHVYSLEFLDQACRAAARARYVLTVPPDSVPLSDLALADTVPFDDARRASGDPDVRIRPRLTARPGEPIRFYWEVYGLDEAAVGRRLAVRMEVTTASNTRVPVARLSALRAEGVADVSLGYEAVVPGGSGPVAMALTIRLEGDRMGVFVARLEIRDPETGRVARADRPFTVEPGG